MSQVTGFPGGGVKLSKSVSIFTGAANPNDSTVQEIQLAGLSSLFLQSDVGALWLCTTAGVFDAATQTLTPSVWTLK